MSKFADAMKKQAKKAWDDNKHAEGGARNITAPIGTHRGLLVYELSVGTKGAIKGMPIVEEIVAIDQGDYVGKGARKSFILGGDYADRNCAGLAKHLKKAFPDDADDIAEMDVELLAEYLDSKSGLNDYRIEFEVIETELEDKDTKQTKAVIYFDIVGPVAGEASAASADDDDDDDVVDDEDFVPAKGDQVLYTNEDGDELECTVKRVAAKTETATIVDEDGNEYRVKFDELTPF
jgi:hypothetical protein